MKKNNKDKSKILAVAITVLLLISTLIIFSVTIRRQGNTSIGIGSIIIAATILIFAIFFIKRRYTSVKKGFPAEDERSRKVMLLAGYKTFLISIWYLLILAWASDEYIKFRDPSQALGMGILGMAIIFGLCWLWVNKSGKVE